MKSFFFWESWHKEYRYTWYVTAGVFLFSLLFLWFSYFNGENSVITWERLQEQKEIEAIVHTFRLGPFELNVPGETYIIFEYLNGSKIEPNTLASYIFLFIFSLAAVMIITVITTIEKFWYFIAMGLFIIFIVSLRFEVLGLFGFYNRVPTAVILALYIIPSFYLNRFRPSTSFLTRLFIFAGITMMIAACISFFATVTLPFYHLTITAFTSSLVLTVLFIIMVAHEIVAGFVYIVSQGNSKSLNHMLIISTIYLVNVVITCFHEMGIIDWNFIYINLFLLLTISAIIGIWGFRHRETMYSNIISFYPFGAFFFVAIGAVCFATMAQLLANANDPGVKIIREIIIFAHAGYGFIFLLYIFSNFSPMLAKNMPVTKVLFNPTRMPYFTFRLGGLIVTLAFAFNMNWREYVYHGLSAYYNSGGDMYTLEGNETYAEAFYNKGRSQGFQNHRSNYALGAHHASRYNFKEAHARYEAANAKRPTPYSLTNAGNVYLWEAKYYDAIKTYKVGLSKTDNSGVLTNNLGLAYIKVHRIDSAVMFLNKAREFSLTRNAAETNFFAMAAQEILPLKVDSILRVFDSSSPGTLCNALALATAVNTSFDVTKDPVAEKQLDLYTATYLNNYIVKYAKEVDTTFIKKAYAIASDSINTHFSEALKSSLAFAFYHQGNISKALEILAEQVYLSQSYQGKFNYIMGLWALEQQNPLRAATYFSYADTYDYKEAPFYRAIALTEAGKTKKALIAWDSVAIHGSTSQQLIAAQIKRILTLPSDEAITLNDAEKYQFCRYRIGITDSILFNQLSNSFNNANYKAQALLDISKKYLEADKITSAIYYYRRIAGLELTDKKLYEDFRHFELIMLAYRKEIHTLARQINNGITFDASRRLEKIYYSALIHENNGDVDSAERNYRILATYNPYFEEGVIAAYQFFRKQDSSGFYAYNILAEAVQINAESIRLWKEYYNEAVRLGFDEYAASASLTIQELEKAE